MARAAHSPLDPRSLRHLALVLSAVWAQACHLVEAAEVAAVVGAAVAEAEQLPWPSRPVLQMAAEAQQLRCSWQVLAADALVLIDCY